MKRSLDDDDDSVLTYTSVTVDFELEADAIVDSGIDGR